MRTLVIALALLACGCETTKLWRGESQDEYVKIVPQTPEEDVELALKSAGREYHCKQLYYSSHANNKICYAKVTADEKLDNIGIKFLKTPETLAIDAGKTVLVVGYIVLAAMDDDDVGKARSDSLPKPCGNEKCD